MRSTQIISTPAGAVAVVDLPLACCGLESSRALFPPSEERPVAVAICISGTLTAKLAPVLEATIADIAAAFPGVPVYRVGVGACACSGGPYWDSPSVLPGHSVDLMVPGCPPSPQAIADALGDLLVMEKA